MNEENKDEIIGSENSQNELPDSGAGNNSINITRRTVYIAIAFIVVVSAVLLLAFLRTRTGGETVPAPRSVSFGNDEDQESSTPAEEQTLTIEPDQVERIGLKIETVGETISTEAAEVASTGVVEPDAYSETPIISLVGGIVRRVNVELGDTVRKGQTVGVIFSDELAAVQSRFLSLQTEVETARQNYERSAKLLKINPVSRLEYDEAQAKLKTKEAELDEATRRYNRTQKLISIGAASREELEQDSTKMKAAEAEVEQWRKQSGRASELVSINPTGSSDLEQAAVKLRTARTELASTKERLLLLGLTEQRLKALNSPSQISSEVALTAPVAGTVTSRGINQGEVVDSNRELLKITDLSTVWVIAQIYEKDLGKMKVGGGASVTTDAYPGKLFRGQVTYIDPSIKPETRTAQVRIQLDNPGQIFRIGMYVNVSFGVLGTGEMTVPVIPSAAVQNMNNRTVVFAATDKPNVFIVKPVRMGVEKDGKSVVLEGLNVGDRIVTAGSFLLRAELFKQRPTSLR